jgi:hypothetical protein
LCCCCCCCCCCRCDGHWAHQGPAAGAAQRHRAVCAR